MSDGKLKLSRSADGDTSPYVPSYDSEGHEIVNDNGKDVPVVPMNRGDTQHLTKAQRDRVSSLYIKIASFLPTEGRDYTVDFTFENGDVPRIHLRAMTEIGSAFIKHVHARLSDEMRLQQISKGMKGREVRTSTSVSHRFDVPMSAIPEPLRSRIAAGEQLPLYPKIVHNDVKNVKNVEDIEDAEIVEQSEPAVKANPPTTQPGNTP